MSETPEQNNAKRTVPGVFVWDMVRKALRAAEEENDGKIHDGTPPRDSYLDETSDGYRQVSVFLSDVDSHGTAVELQKVFLSVELYAFRDSRPRLEIMPACKALDMQATSGVA